MPKLRLHGFDCENSRFHEISTVKFVVEDEVFFGKISKDDDFRPRSDWTKRSRPFGKTRHEDFTNSGENRRKRLFEAKPYLIFCRSYLLSYPAAQNIDDRVAVWL